MSSSTKPRTLMITTITTITIAFITITIALALTPSTTSVKGIAPSSSGMKLCKHFEYDYLLMPPHMIPAAAGEGWKATDYFIEGLEVSLYKADCGNLICHSKTDELGNICWDGLTEGGYYIEFSWNGKDYKESIYLCCNAEEWEFADNYLPPKGEDGALSSFSSEVASPTRFFG